MTLELRKILCAVDFSESSRVAMRFAAELAASTHTPLVLAYVWELPRALYAAHMPISPGAMQELVDAEQKRFKEWADDARTLGAPQVTTQFLTGVAFAEIVRAATDDVTIGLVVMGTNGRTGLRHVLIGSVAEKVVRHAPCRVLVTRDRE